MEHTKFDEIRTRKSKINANDSGSSECRNSRFESVDTTAK